VLTQQEMTYKARRSRPRTHVCRGVCLFAREALEWTACPGPALRGDEDSRKRHAWLRPQREAHEALDCGLRISERDEPRPGLPELAARLNLNLDRKPDPWPPQLEALQAEILSGTKKRATAARDCCAESVALATGRLWNRS